MIIAFNLIFVLFKKIHRSTFNLPDISKQTSSYEQLLTNNFYLNVNPILPWGADFKLTKKHGKMLACQFFVTWLNVSMATIKSYNHITDVNVNFHKPFPHLGPPNPAGQLQVNRLIRSMHVPPWWQGLLEHSFSSTNNKLIVLLLVKCIMYNNKF